ncbi:MAG: fibronectin type III domain-containing protein [Actinobacteria bacterium]|nr:fibronectin type III domain-containing protein [Actinomycetota bacterium]
MSPRSRRHGVPRLAFLGVLVAMLLALGLAGTAAAGAALPAQDVVVNVTAGANDPVSGATVVARDDRTGRVMSSATTTGYLGYAAIRLRPGASTQRITITATGGRSKAVGTLSAADVMSATAQRAVMASEIEVNVNPGSTVLAEYLDERPRASVATAERVVARRLRLPKGTDVAESARFSRLRFSGEDFIGAARKRGGVEDYAEWAAERISAADAVRSFAAPRPADEIPLRGTLAPSPLGAGPRREQAYGGAAFSVIWTLAKPLVELGARKAYCWFGLKELCTPETTPSPSGGGLTDDQKKQLADIETGISNLSAQMTTMQQSLDGVGGVVAALGTQVGTLNYTAEMNAVDDVIRNTRIVAGLRAQDTEQAAAAVRALRRSLEARYGINSGCPNWPALVGVLPRAVVANASDYPNAACTSLAQGLGTGAGLLQLSQRRVASATPVLAAGVRQRTVDAAGEYWLGEFARNVFSVRAAEAYASRPDGPSTRTGQVADATGELFDDATLQIEADATGAYFGARIPEGQFLIMGPTNGTLYGIGTYRADSDPCFGNGSGFVAWTKQQRGRTAREASYFPTRGLNAGPAFSGACTPHQLVVPPPPVPGAAGAPDGSWVSPDALPAAHLPGVLEPLRWAALCHMRGRVLSPTTLATPAGGTWGGLCQPYPVTIPSDLLLHYSLFASPGAQVVLIGDPLHRQSTDPRGVLPNLQLSLKNSACHPWMAGFLNLSEMDIRLDKFRGGQHRLPTASGMQCPVVDVSPRAAQRTGWNCVRASGDIAFWGPGDFIRRSGYYAGVTQPVTSSLPVLNNPTMGGYCPNLGERLALPSGLTASLARPDPWIAGGEAHGGCATLRPCRREELHGTLAANVTWMNHGIEGAPDICSPALSGLLTSYRDPEVWNAGCVGPNFFNSPRFGGPLWPLQRQIRALTTYTGAPGLEAVPGYRSENWTFNNEVAGDFVVGPLYTSTAVGAYVPGISPDQVASAGAPRVAGARKPDPVRDVSACVEECTGDPASLRVQWRPPASSGGLTIRRYDVVGTARGTTRTCTVPAGNDLQCTFGSLDLSQRWEFRVRATNALGASATTLMAFSYALDRPTVLPSREALAVHWSTLGAAPADASGVHRYTATASPGGSTCTVAGLGSTACTIRNLVPGTAYTVRVVRTSVPPCSSQQDCDVQVSTAPASAPAVPQPFTHPGPPGGVELHGPFPAPNEGIGVKWAKPTDDGGEPILGYTATASPGGATCTTLAQGRNNAACILRGLAPGVEYSVSVTATNARGTGPPSGSTTLAMPAVLPGPPLTPLVRASFGSVEVNWVAPDSNGGAVITGYTATASPGGARCSTDGATTCTITGLPEGTEHQVTVTATNAVGTGPASLPAAARTPDLTAPGAPRSVELTALPGRIEAAWSAPESDGGSLVTGYIATASPGGATCTTTGATLCTITGLDDGTAYRVAVAAINVIGTGASSDAGEAVTPRRDVGGAAPVVDDLPLQAVSIPGTADSGLPVSAPVAARRPEITGLALRPRTLVPGLGGRIGYTLSEPADVTITLARVGGRDRASRVVHRIPAGRPGALAGDTFIRVLYSFASARRKKPGAWTLSVEARDAQGGVATKTIPIRVRT